MDLSEIRCFQRVKTCEELLTSPDPKLMVVLKSKLVSRLFPRHLVQIVSNSSRKRPRIFCYSKSRRLAFRLNNSRRLTISNGVFCYKNNRTLTDQASYIQKQIFSLFFPLRLWRVSTGPACKSFTGSASSSTRQTKIQRSYKHSTTHRHSSYFLITTKNSSPTSNKFYLKL